MSALRANAVLVPASMLVVFLTTACLGKKDSLSKSRFDESARVIVGEREGATLLELSIPKRGDYRAEFADIEGMQGLALNFPAGSCSGCKVIIYRVSSGTAALAPMQERTEDLYAFEVVGEWLAAFEVETNQQLVHELVGANANFAKLAFAIYQRDAADAITSEVAWPDYRTPNVFKIFGSNKGKIGIRVIPVLDTPVIGYAESNVLKQAIASEIRATKWANVASASFQPALPAWASFDLATGTISGQPAEQASEQSYTLTAVSLDEVTRTVTFSITVGPWYPESAPAVGVNNATYGWTVAGATPTSFSLGVIAPPDLIAGSTTVTYECKTWSTHGGAPEPSWTACDQATGVTTSALPVKEVAYPDGEYNIKARAVANGIAGPETPAYTFYAHSSLSTAHDCAPIFASISDQALLDAAAAYPKMASVHTFGAQTSLGNPRAYIQWANGNVGEIRSLRKRFVRGTSGGIDLILVRRVWSKSNAAAAGVSCSSKSPAWGYNQFVDSVVEGLPNLHRENESMNCIGFAFNADGKAVCLPKNLVTNTLDPVANLYWTRKFGDLYGMQAGYQAFALAKPHRAVFSLKKYDGEDALCNPGINKCGPMDSAVVLKP